MKFSLVFSFGINSLSSGQKEWANIFKQLFTNYIHPNKIIDYTFTLLMK